MIISALKIFKSHGRQVISDLEAVQLPEAFRGRPVLSSVNLDPDKLKEAAKLCPTGALNAKPFSLDMGRCLFCGECAQAIPHNITFSNSWRIWSFTREGMVITPASPSEPEPCPNPYKIFRRAFKLRQVSAGGDATCEMELGAAGNVNFDMRRYGIEFTASPRHSDAMVLTGPVTANMLRATEATFAAIPQPRLLIAVGTDAISGGLFADSPAIDRSFFNRHTPALYVAGNPTHPLAFIGGVRALTGHFHADAPKLQTPE